MSRRPAAWGAGAGWTIRKHILPNLISPLLVQASFVFAFAQLGAASLDFLGLGAPPEIPSWGNMLAESRTFITRAPWLLFFPGLMIVLTAFSLNLVGDALRDRLDPRFREMLAGKEVSRCCAVSDLTDFRRPGRRHPSTSFRRSRLTIDRGEILGLVGESG